MLKNTLRPQLPGEPHIVTPIATANLVVRRHNSVMRHPAPWQRGVFACVGGQVVLCDPISWQASSQMDYH